jgi:hypothetical protein
MHAWKGNLSTTDSFEVNQPSCRSFLEAVNNISGSFLFIAAVLGIFMQVSKTQLYLM